MAFLHFNATVPVLSIAIAVTLLGCSDPAPPTPEAAAAVLQGNQLRFPAGHPQLALLTTVDVRPSTAVAIDLPANEEKIRCVRASFHVSRAGRSMATAVDGRTSTVVNNASCGCPAGKRN